MIGKQIKQCHNKILAVLVWVFNVQEEMDLNLVIHYDKSYIGIFKCIRIRESEKVVEYSAVIEKSKSIILVSSSWTKYFNVINLFSRTF